MRSPGASVVSLDTTHSDTLVVMVVVVVVVIQHLVHSYSQTDVKLPEDIHPWESACLLSYPRTGRELTAGWSRPAWVDRQARWSPHWSLPSWLHCYHSAQSWGLWLGGHCWLWWRGCQGSQGTRGLGGLVDSLQVQGRYNWVHCN